MSETTEGTQETKTFTQDDLDRVVAERLSRERAKFADYEDIKAKAAKFDQLEAEKQTEQEKLASQIKDAEQKRVDAENTVVSLQGTVLKYQIAAEKGLDLKAAARLTGTTREEIEADADAFKASFAPASTGQVPGVGNTGGDAVATSPGLGTLRLGYSESK